MSLIPSRDYFRNNVAFRNDTLLGVCESLGHDLGFNPMFLRVPLGGGIIFAPLLMVPPPSGLSAAKAAELSDRRGAVGRAFLDFLSGEAGALGKMSVDAPEFYGEVGQTAIEPGPRLSQRHTRGSSGPARASSSAARPPARPLWAPPAAAPPRRAAHAA